MMTQCFSNLLTNALKFVAPPKEPLVRIFAEDKKKRVRIWVVDNGIGISEEGQKKMETVLVAAKKEAVQSRVDVLESAGLKPAILDVDSFALENVYERTTDAQERVGSALYLNLGHTVTNLSIIEAGIRSARIP